MENKYMTEWKRNSIRIGAPTCILAAFTAFIPVLYLCSRYNCWPSLEVVLSAWALTALSFGAFYIVEPISYYAALGMSGTYLGFLSGNIGNMRVPCAALALDVTESESGTIQAEVVSTMAICGSIITNLIATTSAVLVGSASSSNPSGFSGCCLEELCSRSHLWRNLWKLCSQISKDCCIWSLNSYSSEIIHSDSGMDDHRMCRIRYTWNCPSVL